jgi:hypothetical protein
MATVMTCIAQHSPRWWESDTRTDPDSGRRRPRPHLRALRIAGCAFAVAALTTVLAPSLPVEGSALHWSVATSPNSGSGDNVLAAVTCTTSESCVAVGDDGQTLVESSHGGEWSVASSPDLGGGVLDGVSCAGSDFCMAVGYGNNGAIFSPTLAEIWNGSTWSIVPTPNPGDSYNLLGAVSCTSSTFCMAVGWSQSDEDASMNLIETWDGTAWSVVPSPNPNGGDGLLEGVWCSDPTDCMAVGESTPSGPYQAGAQLEWGDMVLQPQSKPGSGG